MNKKQTIRLNESQLRRIVSESVKKLLKEGVTNEFTFSDSVDLGRGRHRQTIFYNGKEIGYLVSIEKNWLSPIEEKYLLPDVEYGMDSSGWIKFKVFKTYDEAFRYASQNFKEIAYLFEYGDCD